MAIGGVADLGDPKVEELRHDAAAAVAGLGQEDIVGLQVTVHDAHLVRPGEAAADEVNSASTTMQDTAHTRAYLASTRF